MLSMELAEIPICRERPVSGGKLAVIGIGGALRLWGSPVSGGGCP